MIRHALAKRYSEAAGGAAPGDGGIDIWDELRPIAGGAESVRRAVAGLSLPDLPSWPGWPGRRGRKADDLLGPAGTASNAGEYHISADDLGDWLARLHGSRPERAYRVLAGMIAHLFRARGERPELEDDSESPGGMFDV